MKKIPLTQGKFALVDDEDFELINGFNWCAAKKGQGYYAVRSSSVKKKDIGCENRHPIYLHQMVIKIPKDKVLDHINGNTLDNRKKNLRVCSQLQNKWNSKKPITNTSGFKGVTWDKYKNKWKSQIRSNGRGKHLGNFDDLKKAAVEYDKAAKRLFGEFAKMNFPDNVKGQ
jgi:hypothetical protein